MAIKSRGRYPVKAKTLVADVARWQNDGTDRGITPSKFIERAMEESDGWTDELDRALLAYISGLGQAGLVSAAAQIAKDISRVCDRIRTGQLKASFDGIVE